MVNFNTKNIALVEFAPNAGGKFLINCCALSEHSVLQSAKYASMQLNNQLSSNDKFNIIKNAILLNKEGEWNDFGRELGCSMLFGNATWHVRDENEYSDAVRMLSNKNETCVFYKVMHSRGFTHNWLKLWDNAKIVVFKNESSFIERLRPSFTNNMHGRRDLYWRNIRGSDWPLESPTTYSEYSELSNSIKTELRDNFHNEILGYLPDSTELNVEHFSWDVNWYFDVDLTLYNIGMVYEFFGLPDFEKNAKNIKELYHMWASQNNIKPDEARK